MQFEISDAYLDPGWHDITVTPVNQDEQNYRIVFETDGNLITSIRIGKLPEVQWVEGCY
jgi:hypothetical protein